MKDFFKRILAIQHHKQSPKEVMGLFKERRYPRLKLKENKKVFFEVLNLDFKEPLVVEVISFGGLGLKNDTLQKWPPVSTLLEGQLIIDNEVPEPLSLEIVYHSPHDVGCRFINPSPFVLEFISDQFHTEFLALKMTKLDPPTPSSMEEGIPWWFGGPTGEEVFFIEKNSRVLRFNIFFEQHFIVYNLKKELKYAFIPNGIDLKEIQRSEPLNLQTYIPSQVIKDAFHFIENISDILETHQTEILKILKLGEIS